MMIVALVVVLVVAVVLTGLLVTTKQGAQLAQQEAARQVAGLESEREELTTLVKTQADAIAEAKVEATKLSADIDSERSKVAELQTDLRQTNGVVAEQKARIEMQLGQVADLITERSSLQSRLAESEAARAAAAARNVGFTIDESLAGDDARAAALWELELLRSERTWRTSVAPNPAATHSPFDGIDDPVRLATEIEASALRENVGTSVGVIWETSPISDPGRSHLVLRVAQELLEAAARSSEPFELTVETVVTEPTKTDADDSSGLDEVKDGGSEPTETLKLHLTPVDEGPVEDLLNFIPPRITSELVDVSEDGKPNMKVNLG